MDHAGEENNGWTHQLYAEGSSARQRIHAAASFIEENFQRALKLDEIAAEVGLSKYHFLRLFKKVTGVTPHQYLLRARLAEAARLLTETWRPVTDVARRVGFGTLPHFVYAFGKQVGCSPTAYREAALRQRLIAFDRSRTQSQPAPNAQERSQTAADLKAG